MPHAVRRMCAGSLAVLLSSTFGTLSAQTLERVKAADAGLDCAALAQESRALDATIAAGDANNGAVTRSAAGAAAGVGGQVVGSIVGGLFGALGSVVAGQVGNAAARQATESSMAPDAAAKQRAADATARKSFLTRLASAKGCKADDATFAGNALSPEEFEKVAAAVQPATLTPLTVASVAPVLGEKFEPYPAGDAIEGKLDLKGKRFYVAEFRVLFDVGGKVSANTRAGYMPGRDYGATSARVNYSVPAVDVAAFQAITDKAYEDFRSRLATAGVKLEDPESFVREHGAVYEATEQPSRPGAPVFFEKSLGHSERKYLVMAPTGTRIHSRGFAGLGAGNIGKRIEWSRANLEAISITVAVNVAELESSGSGSSILRRGSSAEAKEGMSVSQGPDAMLIQTHANVQGLRMSKAIPIEGNFARFREAGGYDSSKDAAARTAGILSNMAGLGANQSKRVDLEIDLDGPATARMALRGLATVNQALAERIKAGM